MEEYHETPESYFNNMNCQEFVLVALFITYLMETVLNCGNRQKWGAWLVLLPGT